MEAQPGSANSPRHESMVEIEIAGETGGESSRVSSPVPGESAKLLGSNSGPNYNAFAVGSEETRVGSGQGVYNVARYVSAITVSVITSVNPFGPRNLVRSPTWRRLDAHVRTRNGGFRKVIVFFLFLSLYQHWIISLTQSCHPISLSTSVICALLTSNCEMSVIVAFALAVLSFTRSFECETKDGIAIECSRCGLRKPGLKEIYQCDGYKEAFEQALSGYSNDINWLVFCAFHLGHAVKITLLGKRLSLLLIKYMGWSILGLGYAITISELLLGPFVPSNAARGGSIVLPIVTAVATSLGSKPTHNPATGRYLMLVGAHSNLISASFYLTGEWIFLYGLDEWVSGPSTGGGEDTDGNAATRKARVLVEGQLQALGPMSVKEKQLSLTLLSCLFLWATDPYTGLNATGIAFTAITVLLLMETITWKNILDNTKAWDTFFWLGGFITIAQQLTDNGVSAFLGRWMSDAIQHVSTSPLIICIVLSLAYFFSTFLFSSLTAHIVAFVGPFLEAGKALNVPGMLLVGLLGYFSSLGGCMVSSRLRYQLLHRYCPTSSLYSRNLLMFIISNRLILSTMLGSVVMYFAEGYVSRSYWFAVGFMMSAVYITVFLSIGLPWWKLLGWY
ncbi:Sodium:sulfate symporter transmembrane region-domain-containing protein [Jimgerdemannia flammicorona]|uniref:Sodium:sulfate symporter transmembrane region-domain-containing protein n=1 Tax=Jimgerdemannia flammicorona TaxID=994334 RepID=A0A433D8H7_9FUNG|nr:Sodium:sulfate symporter transmembrane region-domain-containing protein [Jimgerdemannia flammicorona]